MTVEFFFCEPMEYTSEQRAFYRAARLLHRKFAADPRYFALVGNVTIPDANLPQVDAILFSETLIALIDFKKCGDPIQIPKNEKATWYAVTPAGQKYIVRGGNAKNPRIQARKTHFAWTHYFKNHTTEFLSSNRVLQLASYWNHMKGWVLFEPRLHPKTGPIPAEPKDWRWLSFAGVGDILNLWHTQNSKLQLAPSEIETVIQTVLHAQRDSNFSSIFEAVIGYLTVPAGDGTPIRHPVSRFETLTVGRSGKCTIQIPDQYRHVSGEHARIETSLAAARLFDDQSTHGIRVDGAPVGTGGTQLAPNTVIELAPDKPHGCRLRYEANTATHIEPQTTPTL